MDVAVVAADPDVVRPVLDAGRLLDLRALRQLREVDVAAVMSTCSLVACDVFFAACCTNATGVAADCEPVGDFELLLLPPQAASASGRAARTSARRISTCAPRAAT